MKRYLAVALGIIAALGGFVDIGDIVFNSQAGAEFRFELLWVIPIGVLAIMTFAEMSGRVAIVARKPVFEAIRERMGFGLGLGTLIAAQIVCLMTIAAEIGGIGLILQYLLDMPYGTAVLIAVIGLIISVWFLPFGAIERVFGYGGLMLIVFAVVAVRLDPDWGDVANGFVPHLESSTLYFYFIVGLFAAAVMPYEVYFYSSGAVEEQWDEKDLGLNRLNAILGFGLGGFLSIAIVIVAAVILEPRNITPDQLGTVALLAQNNLAELGLLLGLLGMFFAFGGAAIDATFSAAYNLSQFLGWEWGKHRHKGKAPRFTITWLAMFAAGFAVVATGVDPIQITEYSVVFSVVVLPLTYLPLLLTASDKSYMGKHANGWFANIVGWFFFVVIVVVAVAAIPLLLATNGGGG